LTEARLKGCSAQEALKQALRFPVEFGQMARTGFFGVGDEVGCPALGIKAGHGREFIAEIGSSRLCDCCCE